MAADSTTWLTEQERRRLGSYYTPDRATELMARWLLEHRPVKVLEPSFGNGAFLAAIEAVAGNDDVELHGAELDETAFEVAATRLRRPLRRHAGDFLEMPVEPVDGVIGNPPFVRLRHLPARQSDAALRAASDAMGRGMEPSGSTWMPFVLRASEALRPGGCFALVLPLEITHVRYARPLWSYLARTFGRLRLIRTHQRVFDDLLQDVVILLGENKGASTEVVEFQMSDELIALDDAAATKLISISDIEHGGRPFHFALLPSSVQDLVAERLTPSTSRIGDLVKVRIGYVTGDKSFFHPDEKTRAEFNLPQESIRKAIGAGRTLRAQGLWTSGLPDPACQALWLPTPENLTPGEKRYIAHGENMGVSQRYKCAVRSPWWLVPGVETPDLIFSVFSDSPAILLNDAGFVASNSHLCGFLKNKKSVATMVAGWFTSITQLSVELEVHSLGGGVLVAVPQELGKVRVPSLSRVTTAHLKQISIALRAGDQGLARAIGDELLIQQSIIGRDELELVQEGIAAMRKWRIR